jgi:hypothetical protein
MFDTWTTAQKMSLVGVVCLFMHMWLRVQPDEKTGRVELIGIALALVEFLMLFICTKLVEYCSKWGSLTSTDERVLEVSASSAVRLASHRTELQVLREIHQQHLQAGKRQLELQDARRREHEAAVELSRQLEDDRRLHRQYHNSYRQIQPVMPNNHDDNDNCHEDDQNSNDLQNHNNQSANQDDLHNQNSKSTNQDDQNNNNNNNNNTLSAVRQSEEDVVLRRREDRIQALRKRGSGHQSNERNVRQRHNDNEDSETSQTVGETSQTVGETSDGQSVQSISLD